MANILIKQGREIAGSSLVNPSTKADKTDLTSIIQTGTTSSQAISAGTYFYLNDVLVKAKVDIANGATFTLNTNYEVVTAGALNELNNAIKAIKDVVVISTSYGFPSITIGINTATISLTNIPTGYKAIGVLTYQVYVSTTANIGINRMSFNTNGQLIVSFYSNENRATSGASFSGTILCQKI